MAPAPHVWFRTLVVAVAAAVTFGGLATVPAAAVVDPTPAPATTSATTTESDSPLVAEAGTLRWQRCRSAGLAQARCAKLRVPLDPADPSGPTIRIALSRVAHTSSDRKYRGVLLLNPGGPGGSGLRMSTTNNSLPAKVAGRYDWIGFDPRGVGASRPHLSCRPSYTGFARPDYYPKPKANADRWLKRSAKYARACERNGGALLNHMRTTDVAADMDRIRAALGADRLNFLGFSYGTYLGQVYATLFPGRVGRMVLDSNVDPQRAFYQANLDQDVAMQRVLNKWFRWVARKNGEFGLGRSAKVVAERFDRTQDRLRRHPAGGKIGPAEWTDIFNQVTYSMFAWRPLAQLFGNYRETGKSKDLVQAFKGTSMYGDDNTYAVYNAVQCTDAPWPDQWSTWKRDNWATYRDGPNFTWMNVWFNAPCLYWPVAAGPRVTVGNDSPLLLVGGSDDGATPFTGSLTVRRLFPQSSLVELKKTVSHAVGLTNRCSRKWISRYLASGELPQRKPGDRPDVRCDREAGT